MIQTSMLSFLLHATTNNMIFFLTNNMIFFSTIYADWASIVQSDQFFQGKMIYILSLQLNGEPKLKIDGGNDGNNKEKGDWYPSIQG